MCLSDVGHAAWGFGVELPDSLMLSFHGSTDESRIQRSESFGSIQNPFGTDSETPSQQRWTTGSSVNLHNTSLVGLRMQSVQVKL